MSSEPHRQDVHVFQGLRYARHIQFALTATTQTTKPQRPSHALRKNQQHRLKQSHGTPREVNQNTSAKDGHMCEQQFTETDGKGKRERQETEKGEADQSRKTEQLESGQYNLERN